MQLHLLLIHKAKCWGIGVYLCFIDKTTETEEHEAMCSGSHGTSGKGRGLKPRSVLFPGNAFCVCILFLLTLLTQFLEVSSPLNDSSLPFWFFSSKHLTSHFVLRPYPKVAHLTETRIYTTRLVSQIANSPQSRSALPSLRLVTRSQYISFSWYTTY